MQPKTYLPAAGHDWFLPLYDPITRLLGGDAARQALLDHAAIRSGHRVLDVGCGTGTLAVQVKRLHPDVEVVGVDPDSKALERARRKAERASVAVQFDGGYSTELPYPAASFDRALSSFMLHHLSPDDKDTTLREIRRVLRPGGVLSLLDFGGSEPHSRGLVARLLHSSQRLSDNFGGGILTSVREAGFADVKEVEHRSTLLGRVAYYRAS